MTDKRKRGRPKGSVINDECHLDAVAERLVANQRLKKSRAIALVVENSFPEHQWGAAERRLHRKWNEVGEQKLAATRARAGRAKQNDDAPVYRRDIDAILGSKAVSGSLRAVERLSLSSKALGCNASIMIAELQSTPNSGLIEAAKQASALQRLQDLVDPPGLRLFREVTARQDRLRRAVSPFG